MRFLLRILALIAVLAVAVLSAALLYYRLVLPRQSPPLALKLKPTLETSRAEVSL